MRIKSSFPPLKNKFCNPPQEFYIKKISLLSKSRIGVFSKAKLQSWTWTKGSHSQFCKSALIPQPLLLRTVSDLRASLCPSDSKQRGLLPKWEKGSRSQSPSPAPPLGAGILGWRAAKLGCTLWTKVLVGTKVRLGDTLVPYSRP